jgi:hypothetical protein
MQNKAQAYNHQNQLYTNTQTYNATNKKNTI